MLPHPSSPKIIGITGSIASGKSAVTQYLKQKNLPVIDADQLGHRVLHPEHEGYRKIVAIFGPDILNEDQTINRKALGNVVFADPEKLKQLNAISRPQIARMFAEEIKQLSGQKIVFLEAAILIEAGWHKSCHEVWVVTTDENHAIRRLVDYKNYTEDQARARLQAQLTHEERKAYAHCVITNNGSLEELHDQVEQALQPLTQS
ncbi:MAG: dephospho-CoA kinase [SAR324 cluster bacterium]|nr:dephospho-CoA kinase [SAR324 cluster bacterium]